MKNPPVLAAFDKAAQLLALIAGAAVVALSFLIVFDIVARSLFRYSIQGTDELGGYTLALVGSLGLAYTLMRRGHPRIDIAFKHFPARMQAALHVLSLATIAGFALFMTRHAYGELSETLAFGTITNTPLQTPLWVPQTFWVAGTAFFALAAIAMTVHGALLFFSSPDRVGNYYGPLTVKEEVLEYVSETAPGEGPEKKDV